MKVKGIYLIFPFMFFTAMSCKKPYTPTAVTSGADLLVVEGIINAGADSTFIRLSHTVKLSEKTSAKPETGANVTVEGEGVTYRLSEMSNGTYVSAGLNLNSAKQYHLKIHTANGQDYVSDDVEVKITPPIDSLNYKAETDGLHIYSATHDPSNNTRYYRWDYQENWRFNSLFLSEFKVLGDTIVERLFPQDDISQCYSSARASTIVINTSARSSEDIITQNPITQIVPTSEKISIRYSILLRQYALTKNGYAFWENIKKNTEKLGSIFDALPSEIAGNIHNTANPQIPVIGYISISTVTTKRLYVNNSELPATPEWRTQYPYPGCAIRIPEGNEIQESVIDGNGLSVPIKAKTYTARACADCTIRGTLNKPAFWRDI
jgi:hypothetical protein